MLLDKRTEELIRKFPNDNIDEVSMIIADGGLILNKVQLAKALDVSTRTIEKYEVEGMPSSKYSTPRYRLFTLTTAIEWVILNIDKTKSKRGKAQAAEVPEDMENDWKFRKERADALKTEQMAEEATLKVKELKKELVKKEDTDKAMADLASTMGAMYRNDIKALPVLLENKPFTDIREELDRHYKDRMETMHRILSKEAKVADGEIPKYAFDILFEAIKESDGKN